MDDPLPGDLLRQIDAWYERLVRQSFAQIARDHRNSGEFRYLNAESRRRVLRSLFLRSCEHYGVATTSTLRTWATTWTGEAAPRELAPVRAEWLGVIDEHLQSKSAMRTPCGVQVENDPAGKKPNGVFYTPRPMVRFIIDRTLRVRADDEPPRVLDPACGGGAFLLAAFERLAERHAPTTLAAKTTLLLQCIHGLDVDAQAAETTRLALVLKLLERLGRHELLRLPVLAILRRLEANIRAGNALDGFDWQAGFPGAMSAGGFDVVLGNPPYGAALKRGDRVRLASRFRAGTTDTAALLMLRAQELTRPGGRCGMIVPKPFVYSSTWNQVRDRLLPELETLLDAGKAWPDVKLEQVVYVLRRKRQPKRYQSHRRAEASIVSLGTVSKDDCRVFGLILNDITADELALGRKLRAGGVFFGDVVSNTRGALLQGAVRERPPGLRVIGGKQLRCYRMEGQKGWLPAGAAVPEQARARPDGILVQNIVAHIRRPVEHIRIIATLAGPEADRMVLLDTVNQLRNHSRLSSRFLLGVLLSGVVSWYAYRFIFGKAIRTMHFDGPVTDRLPLPRVDLDRPADRQAHDEIERLVGILLHGGGDPNDRRNTHAGQRVEALVHRLFRLTAEESGFVRRS